MAKRATRPKPERKTYHYSVWVDEAQRDAIDQAFRIAKEDRASTWLRKLAVDAAEKLIADAAKPERKAR